MASPQRARANRSINGKALLFISNGYGEDSVSARIAGAFRRAHPGCAVAGFPTVGGGAFYAESCIELAGRGPELPSEGFVRNPGDFLRDIRNGFLNKTLRLGRDLARAAKRFDYLVMTGDPYLLLFTSIFARFEREKKVFIGVQQSEWYDTRKPFKHHYSALERLWLRRRAGLVFVRDSRTEEYLRGKGLLHVLSAGNPMMDCFDLSGRRVFPAGKTLIGVLPGSKLEAYDNLDVTFEVIRRLAGARSDLVFAFALAKNLSMETIVRRFCLRKRDAPRRRASGAETRAVFRMEGCSADLILSHEIFGDVINESSALIGTSGTANEQAAGMGKPVFGFWGKGPQITKKFLTAQKKLLGPSLFLFPPEPERIAAGILRTIGDEKLLSEVKMNGIVRMEGRGSIPIIVRTIAEYITVKENGGRQDRRDDDERRFAED